MKKSLLARPTDDSFLESVIDLRPRDPEHTLSDDEGIETQVSPRTKEPVIEEGQPFRKPFNITDKKEESGPSTT